MLKELYVSNIALIKELTIDFTEGLNCLSGETGSGKSIIIDSLAFVLGDRADKSLIKHGEKRAIVQAVFDISDCEAARIVLENNGFYPEDDDVFISRMMSVGGKSEIRINGRLTTLNVLRSVSSVLVDIFGQSEHLNLLRKESHLGVIDGYRKCGIFAELQKKYEDLSKILSELDSFGGNEAERARNSDLLSYQINEIQAAELTVGEEERLSDERLTIINSEKIKESVKNALDSLIGEASASDSVSRVVSEIKNAMRFDPSLDSIFGRAESLGFELNDIAAELENYSDNLEYDENRLEEVEERLAVIRNLKRKYGNSVVDILDFCENAKAEFEKLDAASEIVEKLEKEKTDILKAMYELSVRLSEFRRESADLFCRAVENELQDLGMSGAVFSAEFNEMPDFATYYSGTVSPNGFDRAEFYMSANKGEPLKPLIKVISGGEMSRFMLAIKSISARIEGVAIMVFDEIDTGISGEMALRVAQKLKRISGIVQCIVITHLPQLAALSNTNFLISKDIVEDKTQTFIKRLDEEGKVREIARLCGGERGEHSLLYAREMIDELNKSL